MPLDAVGLSLTATAGLLVTAAPNKGVMGAHDDRAVPPNGDLAVGLLSTDWGVSEDESLTKKLKLGFDSSAFVCEG